MRESVYCYKNFVGEKPYEKFEVNKSYQIKSVTDSGIIVICFEENKNWGNGVVFRKKKFPARSSTTNLLPIFEDYFLKIKEYRKLKLQKIFEKS